MKAALRLLLTFLAPGVVLLLVGVQVAYGLRGFESPRGGVATVLEVPGLLVGWGSLAFLVPLLAWLVLDWWGVSAPGLALKCLGAATLALAMGAILGVTGGVTLGGHVGAALAAMLTGSLGDGLAIVLLTVMGVPGLILASAGLVRADVEKTRKAPQPAKKPKPAAPSEAEKPPRGRFMRRKKVTTLADLVREDPEPEHEREAGQPWYPERRFDDDGNELPMRFDARDVGEIRFLESPEDDSEAPEVPPEGMRAEAPAPAGEPEAGRTLPTIPELLSGAYDASALETESEGADHDGDGVAAAPVPEPEEPDVDPDDPNVRVHVDDDGGTRLVVTPQERVVQGLGRVVDTDDPAGDALPEGVRWADPSPAPEPPVSSVHDDPEAVEPDGDADDEPETVALPADDPVHEIMRHPTVAHDVEEPHETPSVRESVLGALDGESPSPSSRRYLEKLEASGIFDFMEGDDDAETEPEKPAKRAKRPPKKAASTSKRPKQKAAKKKKAGTRKKTAKKKRTKKRGPARQTKNAPGPAAKPAKAKPEPKTATRERADTKAPKSPRTWRAGPWRGGQPHASAERSEDPEVEVRRRLLLRERHDPRFAEAALISVERGAASAVLLTRRLGIGFGDAKLLVERLLAAGVLGPPSRSGAHPALLTREAWDALR